MVFPSFCVSLEMCKRDALCIYYCIGASKHTPLVKRTNSSFIMVGLDIFKSVLYVMEQ